MDGMDLEMLKVATDVHQLRPNVTCPSSIDWRMKGFVTDVSLHVRIVPLWSDSYIQLQVKDQGRCGSSWAFSAIGAIEGQLYKKTRTLTSLSEQQLLDCSQQYGNKGCSGGMASAAFAYVHRFGGICRECDYPYLGYVSSYIHNFVQ